MTADYAALEARVADLEQQMRHILPAKVDAISYGVGVMHADMREQLGEHRERLARIELQLGQQGETLADHGRMLADHGRALDDHGRMLVEILRRLPAPPE
jgi:uncharacterized coiled-coil protein SlyX